jgi:DNA-binding GntR family transcriptional regulator
VLAEEAYRRIKEAILRLDLAPGSLVSERYLEEVLQVSRTPIRAALSRLETERFVARKPRGYLISGIDIPEYEHAYAFRMACEVAVVEHAVVKASRKDIERIDELLCSGAAAESTNQWFEQAIDFHLELARIVGNPFLFKGIQESMMRLERVRWFCVWAGDGRERATREHRDILRLIQRKETVDAVGAMRRHIGNSRQIIMDSLKAKEQSSVFGQGVYERTPRGGYLTKVSATIN